MAKKSKRFSDGEINLGTDAWNVADGWSQMNVLRPLILMNIYDTQAQFGTEDINEQLDLTDLELYKKRVEALQRFHSIFKQLIDNIYFVLRKDGKEQVDIIRDRLDRMDEFIPKSYEGHEDLVTHEEVFKINEKLFNYILSKLELSKREILKPLNSAGLIFRQSEEVDLDKIMNDIVEGG